MPILSVSQKLATPWLNAPLTAASVPIEMWCSLDMSWLRNPLSYFAKNTITPILVGRIPTPLKNMSSSVGMMTFPNMMGKMKVIVANHQPV